MFQELCCVDCFMKSAFKNTVGIILNFLLLMTVQSFSCNLLLERCWRGGGGKRGIVLFFM